LKWVSNTKPSQSISDFIDRQYPKFIEVYFSKLRNECFTYCLKKTNDSETSEDIAQDVIIQLLKSKQEIRDVRLWLRGVTCNMLCKTYRNNHEYTDMLDRLRYEALLLYEISCSLDGNLIEHDMALIDKELTNTSEYIKYKEILEYQTLSEYAKSNGITYEQAKQVSKEIHRNYKSMCLRHLGWEDSPDILSFNQLKSIQRYLRQLIHFSNSYGKPVIHKNSLLLNQAEMKHVLSGYDHIDDWGIHMIGQNKFRIHIFCNPGNIEPLCATVIITIKENNRIVTESCRSNKLASVLTIPPNVTIPKNKGKSALTFEQIKTILSE